MIHFSKSPTLFCRRLAWKPGNHLGVFFYSTLSKMLMTQSGDNRSGEKERDVGYKWNLLMN